MILLLWVFMGFLTYVFDPFEINHAKGNPRGERLALAMICLVGWPFVWAIYAAEVWTGNDW